MPAPQLIRDLAARFHETIYLENSGPAYYVSQSRGKPSVRTTDLRTLRTPAARLWRAMLRQPTQ